MLFQVSILLDVKYFLFSRVSLPVHFVEMVIGKLRTDDIYNQVTTYVVGIDLIIIGSFISTDWTS
jgi:hypothetical protein